MLNDMETILHPSEVRLNGSSKKKRQLFRDPALQESFDHDGYVVIDFLTPAEVDRLTEAYANLQGDLGTPAFASTVMSYDAEYRIKVSAIIESTFARAINEIFQDARFFWGNFNIKYPRNNMGAVPLHQDHSFLDERLFQTLGLWVPLVNTTPENGALQVIPGSHTLLKQLRCGGRPFPYATYQQTLLEQFGKQLLMQAGQAYIGNPALFHASPPNVSAQPRIVAAGLAGPSESSLIYCHYHEINNTGMAEIFEVDHRYYVTAPLFSKPDISKYRLSEIIRLDKSLPDIESIIEALKYFSITK
jgi:hypothetical protein